MLNSISEGERQLIANLITRSCSNLALEKLLADAGMLISFQSELLNRKGMDRKKHLTRIILSVVGDELLKLDNIRKEIATKLGISCPNLWKPGSSEAQRFCNDAGIPMEYAGISRSGPQPPFEYVLSGYDIGELQDYQNELIKKSIRYGEDGVSQLISIPTGGGKTRVAMEIAYEWLENRGGGAVLWIAHTEELCEQAVQCFDQLWRSKRSKLPLYVYRAWGRFSRQLEKGGIYRADSYSKRRGGFRHAVVSTPITATRIVDAKIGGDFGETLAKVSIVIVDEAHRAGATSYKRLIDKLKRTTRNDLQIIGLSATPVRETYSNNPMEGTKVLSEIFKKLIEPIETFGKNHDAVSELRNRGVLSELIKKVLKSKNENIARQCLEIAREIKKSSDRRSLLFASTIAATANYSYCLNKSGVRAEFVSSKTSAEGRIKIIDAFKNGEVDIICNCELLTTGFDVPSVSKIFLARDTKSPVLYKQIVGRGIRGPAFGGSDSCTMYFCNANPSFMADPNTAEFARTVWGS